MADRAYSRSARQCRVKINNRKQKYHKIRDGNDKSGRHLNQWTVFLPARLQTKGTFVWDQSGIGIIGIMRVSVCLGAILIPEYLDSILAILLPGAE